MKHVLHTLLTLRPVAWLLRGPLVSAYLESTAVRKLHLGGAGLHGWLNTDLHPAHWRVVRMDATKPFPLPSRSVDYVFSEHMIEHLPLAGARAMLREAHRVLRPGGMIRVATPDLARVVSLYGATRDVRKDYLVWAQEHFGLPRDLPADCAVINSLFHDHGHRFLFDAATLTALLTAAGFAGVARYTPGNSDDPHLRGLERRQFPVGSVANNFETLVLEARRRPE